MVGISLFEDETGDVDGGRVDILLLATEPMQSGNIRAVDTETVPSFHRQPRDFGSQRAIGERSASGLMCRHELKGAEMC